MSQAQWFKHMHSFLIRSIVAVVSSIASGVSFILMSRGYDAIVCGTLGVILLTLGLVCFSLAGHQLEMTVKEVNQLIYNAYNKGREFGENDNRKIIR